MAATFDVLDPATGAIVGSVPDADTADVRAAIDRAQTSFEKWSQVPAIDRGRLLHRAAALILARTDEIARILTSEQGKPLAEAADEVRYAAGFFEWFAGEAERVYGQVVPPPGPDKRVLVLRQPIGVTAAITPWNFPAAMLTRKLGPAIAAGCTSVVKPAEQTPLTAIEICRAIEDAGAPVGLVNVISSTRPRMVGEVLLDDSRVRKLSFTGSTETGRELIRGSADRVTRLSLELGGHAPFIVFDDADVDGAIDRVMASKFRNAGQTCICANRIYVQRGLHDAFVKRLAHRTAALVVGPGTRPEVQIGPLIDADAVAKARHHVEDAVSRGARIVVSAKTHPGDGHFFPPTVLDGVSSDSLIAQEETFGPVAGVTIFDHEADAIRMANDTPYGLAAYVETSDYSRLFGITEQLEFGVVGFNDGAPSLPGAPFGGVKESGFGREGGNYGIDEYVDVKYVSIGAIANGNRKERTS